MRRARRFIRERMGILVLLGVCAGIFAVVLSLYQMPVEAVGYAAALCAALILLCAAARFLWWRRRVVRLEEMEGHASLMLDQLPEPGKEMNFKYTITFSRDEDKLHAPDNAWVQQTRRSTGDVKQSNLIRQPDGTIAFVVDFTGAEMKKLPEDTPVTAQTSIGDNGEIVESTVRYNPVTKGWRLVMRVKVKDAKKTTEMRAALVNADQTLSETWSYQLPANE